MSTSEPEPNVIECRICHSKTTRDLIHSPCLCKGSLAFVHFQCLERWLNYSSRNSCELCSFAFNVTTNQRYTCLQSIRAWVRHPRNRAFIMCDLVIGLVLTILTLTLVGICLFGQNRFVEEGHAQGIEAFWSKGIITIFLIVLIAGYLITVFSMVTDHIRPWYAWWNRCNNVRLHLEKNSSPSFPPPQPIQNHVTSISTNGNEQKLLDINKNINSQEKYEHEVLSFCV